MPSKGKYQPRKVKTDQVLRFRGLADPDSKAGMSKSYVGGMENLPSTKIRQMDRRVGQLEDSVYADGVHTGSKLIVSRVIGEGGNLWAEPLSPFAIKPVGSYQPPVIVIPPPNLPPPPVVPPPPPPPVVPPPNPNVDSMTVTPKEYQFNLIEGYTAASTEVVTAFTFYNHDNITGAGDLSGKFYTYLNNVVSELGTITVDLDPDGLTGYVRVNVPFRIKAGLDVTYNPLTVYLIGGTPYEHKTVSGELNINEVGGFDPLFVDPETESWDLNIGYDETTTTKTFDFEFFNYDELEDAGELNENVTVHVNSDYLTYDNVVIENDPLGKTGYTKVSVDVELVAGLPVGVKNLTVGMSTSREFEYAKATLTISDPMAGTSWLNLYNTYNQRRQMRGNSALPAYSSYNFNLYATQYAFIDEIQDWFEGLDDYYQLNSSSKYLGFFRYGTSAEIHAGTEDDAFVSWDTVKTDSGLTSGWRRDDGLGITYGHIQNGDIIGAHLFQDLDDAFRTIHVVYNYYTMHLMNSANRFLDPRDHLSGIWQLRRVEYFYSGGWNLVSDTTNYNTVTVNGNGSLFTAFKSQTMWETTAKITIVDNGHISTSGVELYLADNGDKLKFYPLASSNFSLDVSGVPDTTDRYIRFLSLADVGDEIDLYHSSVPNFDNSWPTTDQEWGANMAIYAIVNYSVSSLYQVYDD